MRSSGNRFAAAVLLFALARLCDPPVGAQEMPPLQRYEVLFEQELRVLQSAASAAADFRVIINRYWSFVRRYPSSGYADNAVWQAANLSMEAFVRFNEDRDRYRAIQLFQWLRDEYPHSRFAASAAEPIAHLTAAGRNDQAESPPPSPASADSIIRAVHREVLPEVVRITIELDREVPFYQERLDGPPRVFFDLKGTRTVASLVDATFRYDSHIVRHIRLGRHPNNTTRIVLDLENVARYSVFTLYNPYRIVIDAETAVEQPSQTATAGQASDAQLADLASAPHTIEARAVPMTSVRRAPSVQPTQIALAELPSKPIASINPGRKFSVARQLGLGVSRIVIDAGHGGHDPGASAFGISEAELVLDVTLRLEKLLLQQPGIEVVLTRRTDVYLSLEERTEVANREASDLFLSVHANASANAAASGVETYFLNFALNRQAEAVATRENAASAKTLNSLPAIIRAITLNSKLNESRDFAASIQRALVRGLRPSNKTVKDLGVKQAPFMVLIGASMPSVLAEIAFVTNSREARLLKSTSYRDKIAEALLNGILRYQQSLKVPTAASK